MKLKIPKTPIVKTPPKTPVVKKAPHSNFFEAYELLMNVYNFPILAS